MTTGSRVGGRVMTRERLPDTCTASDTFARDAYLRCSCLATAAFAQTDEPYTAEIRKHTTEPRFMTELVDHLPASDDRPLAAEVPRLHRRRGGEAHVCRGCVSLHARARGGVAAGEGVLDRADARKGASSSSWPSPNEETIAEPRSLSRHHAPARRSAQAHRRRSAGAHRRGQADLLRSPARCTRRRPAAPRC